MTATNFEVILQPVGRRVMVPAHTTILDAARAAGVELVAICGGEGVCSGCRIRLVEGALSPRTLIEESKLSDANLAAGYRLACQAGVLGDVRVDIPPESFTTPQRLQIEGREILTDNDPVLVPVDVEVPAAGMQDLRSDLTRVLEGLKANGHPEAVFNRRVAADLPAKLRAHSAKFSGAGRWRVRLALRGCEAVAVLPPESQLFGLAVDIGTTKLAAYLVNLGTRETVAKAGAMNPQIAYGEDVISRITYANDHADGAHTLQSRLVESLNGLLTDLCAEAQVSPNQVLEAVLVGNTVMHHLAAALPVKQLGEAPYVAALSDAMEFSASEIGLQIAPGAYVYLPPNLAGYVGADHVSMLLGAGLYAPTQTTLALDIGTNTEISLIHQGKHFACSCASGPAFEGAHIKDGMRAAPGAIERVRISGEKVQIHTINAQPPIGICGSGILDIVAELRKSALLDKKGTLRGEHPRLTGAGSGAAFVLAPTAETGTGRDVKISRADINEVQLAKAAIRAGIEVLLARAGIVAADIQSFIVAGAFGTYLDIESAITIGMFPSLPRERFTQVGNAAGSGARALLVSAHQRQLAQEISQRVEYVELANHPDFMKIYVKALAFE
jgi:uncharacterized 2Fe-2S/4Fe-4S cluster protein (DUF4445 family)